MNNYEISISVRINPLSSQTGRSTVQNETSANDAVLYGILPDQAAVDEVMNRLCEIGVQIMLANVHSKTAQAFFTAAPQPISLN
jgi:hypothetical protein